MMTPLRESRCTASPCFQANDDNARKAGPWGSLNGVAPTYSEAGTIEALLAEANSALGGEVAETPPPFPLRISDGPSNTQALLSEHLASAQKSLAANHQQVLSILSECVDAVRGTLEAEARELREENSQLRAELPRLADGPRDEGLRSESLRSEGARARALRVGGLAHWSSEGWQGRRTEPARLDAGLPGQTFSLPVIVVPPEPCAGGDAPAERAERPGTGELQLQPARRRRSLVSAGPRPARRQSLISVTSTPMFADRDKMKAKIRQSIAKPIYNVTDFYKEDGIWQRVARSSIFEHLTLMMIAFNAIWIGIDTDYNKQDVLLGADAVFIAMENIFCLFFTVEWSVRFMSFRQTANALRDGWFMFDSVLLAITIVETWLMTLVTAIIVASSAGRISASETFDTDASTLRLIRLLRLSRMARMAKLFRAIPELMIVMKGLAAAIRSVMVTLTMLTIIIYIFGIAFTSLTSRTDTGDRYFPTVLHSMNTLLLHGVFLEDIPVVFNTVAGESVLYGAIFLLFVLIGSFLVVNMLIGVMVETVHVVSMVEREQLSVSFTKDKLLNMMQTTNLDANGDNVISKAEFAALLQIPEAVRALQELGVDVVGLVDLTEYVFENSPQLEFPAFMEMVLALRGSNKATVKDIVDLRKCIRQEIGKLARVVEQGLFKTGAASECPDPTYSLELPAQGAAS